MRTYPPAIDTASLPEDAPPHRTERLARRLGRHPNLLAFAGYSLLSVLIFGIPVLGHLSTRYVGAGQNDAKLYTWCLEWWPRAIAAGQNPFFPHGIYAPQGVNMAWVTGIPGPALVTAPITLAFGAVVSSNLLALLSPALAAFSAFVLCRYVTKRAWPAFFGGLVFGFSTYELTQMRGHLNLLLVFPVPLCVWAVLRLYHRDVGTRRFLLAMGALLAIEFSISTEIFATMTLFGAIALAIAWLVLKGEERDRIAHVGRWVGLSYLVAAAVLSPYLYYAFAHPVPPSFHSPAVAASDLLSYLLPRHDTLIGGTAMYHWTRGFTQRAVGDGAYLGIPLLAIMAVWWVRHRREPAARILLFTFVVVIVFSLGSVLHVDGHALITMPWALVAKLPVIRKAIPSRFGMFAALIGAVVVSCWLAEHRRVPWAWGAVAAGVLLVLPNMFMPVWHGPVSVPAFFSTGEYRRYLSPRETAIVVPYRGGDSMLWQAETHMYFRMAGGYVGTRPAGYVAYPAFRQLMAGDPHQLDAAELRSFAAAHGVEAIIVGDAVAPEWRPILSAAFDEQPVDVGGVTLYRIDPSAAGSS